MPGRYLDRFLFYGAFVLAAAFAAGGWLWAWFVLRDIQSPLILHFSDYTGINQIGGLSEVHGLGATGLVVVGVNFLIAQALRARDRRWAAVLAAATLFLAALLFTALAAIISVNQ
jgi:hypothetical protein